MLTKFKLMLTALVLAGSITLSFSAPAAAQAAAGGASGQAKTDVCAGITQTGGACTDDGTGISNVIKAVVNILSTIAGVASVIMIIIGGMRYVTSGGDSSKISSAKSAITYALVGLIIVAFAQVIVRFVAFKTINGGK